MDIHYTVRHVPVERYKACSCGVGKACSCRGILGMFLLGGESNGHRFLNFCVISCNISFSLSFSHLCCIFIYFIYWHSLSSVGCEEEDREKETEIMRPKK